MKKVAGLSFFLFGLNIWFIRELLAVEYLDQMGSIEGAFIAIARWVAKNWSDLSWFPLWYGGIPFQDTYPPLLHLINAAVVSTGGIAPGLAYHAVTAVAYSLGPVTLFWLGLHLSRSATYSFAAALSYSLISPSAFLMPVVRHDLGSLWNARRLQALLTYGEGPHVTAMTLLPLALLLLALAFEKRRPAWWILAALGLASVALTNWIGAVALAVAVLAWLMAGAEDASWKRLLIAPAVAIYAYAIASPLLPPSTVLVIRAGEKNARPALSGATAQWIWLVGAFLFVALLLWVFARFDVPRHLRFFILFLTPMALVVLAADWMDVRLIPQPERYHLEMEMALVLAITFCAKLLLDRLSSRTRLVVACTLLVLAVYPAVRYRAFARILSRPIEIGTTIEYREARWFDRNMPDRRVMVPGSISFFLNAFTDTAQFSGGFLPGALNPNFAAIHYQILSGQNAGQQEGAVAALWLKAFGVDAVSVSGPRSREVYKDFRNPRKFEGLFPELWRDGDDVIYKVPRRSNSLAHVIRPEDLPSRPPENGLDTGPVQPYVDALEDPKYPLASMTWRGNSTAVISAQMDKEQILSVQISYHPGWSADVNGRPVRVFGDRLGQLAVEPECSGPCRVQLRYDGGLERRLTVALSLLALAGGCVWILVDRRKWGGC